MKEAEKRTPQEVTMTCLGTVVAVLGLMVGSTILNGWILSLLWLWFMVPIFHMAAISIPAGCGIALLVSFLTKQSDTTKDEYQDKSKIYTLAFLVPILVLAYGWVIHQFVR